MKVYISSTLQDLRDHRAAVDRALRRMGHDVIGMERYVAESARPLDRCVNDVKAADLYVLILAWRYGYAPSGDESNPGHLSITHLEFNAARDAGKPVLAFLLDPEAPWPPNHVDAMSTNTEAAEGIARLRNEVATNYLAGIFRTADDLASQAAAAVATQRLGQRLVERLLDQTAVTAASMGNFGQGGDLFDTSLASIKQMVATAGTKRAILIDLGGGDQWWSTRLYLLASLCAASRAFDNSSSCRRADASRVWRVRVPLSMHSRERFQSRRRRAACALRSTIPGREPRDGPADRRVP